MHALLHLQKLNTLEGGKNEQMVSICFTDPQATVLEIRFTSLLLKVLRVFYNLGFKLEVTKPSSTQRFQNKQILPSGLTALDVIQPILSRLANHQHQLQQYQPANSCYSFQRTNMARTKHSTGFYSAQYPVN